MQSKSSLSNLCLTNVSNLKVFIEVHGRDISSNGWHYGVIFFKPEKNLEFFRLKNDPIDAYPGKLE